MAFKTDFTLRLRPTAEIMKEVMVPVAKEYIKAAQEVVGRAAKNHPYTDRSAAGNTARIGWALSAPGAATFGSLTTNAAGTTDTRGAKSPDRRQLTVIVASSSGYGGYLEVGTYQPGGPSAGKRPPVGPFPHIRPAWEIERPKLLRRLKGVVK